MSRSSAPSHKCDISQGSPSAVLARFSTRLSQALPLTGHMTHSHQSTWHLFTSTTRILTETVTAYQTIMEDHMVESAGLGYNPHKVGSTSRSEFQITTIEALWHLDEISVCSHGKLGDTETYCQIFAFCKCLCNNMASASV